MEERYKVWKEMRKILKNYQLVGDWKKPISRWKNNYSVDSVYRKYLLHVSLDANILHDNIPSHFHTCPYPYLPLSTYRTFALPFYRLLLSPNSSSPSSEVKTFFCSKAYLDHYSLSLPLYPFPIWLITLYLLFFYLLFFTLSSSPSVLGAFSS